ncbi:MAG: hypothetical protein C5B44_00805, partial [Acidobacteria bacterium]
KTANTNQSSTRSTNQSSTRSSTQPSTAASSKKSPVAGTTERKPPVAGSEASPSAGVTAAFNKLLSGIRRADVNAVTSVYWNSPRLALFNNNGTVTKGWEQLRKNRESSYPDVKDVKLDVRDVSVTMLGRDAAVVTCLWNQSQTYKGTPESASGRMTLVFKRVGKDWKVIHLHTSPEAPAPSTVMPSEQQTPTATPTPKVSPTP